MTSRISMVHERRPLRVPFWVVLLGLFLIIGIITVDTFRVVQLRRDITELRQDVRVLTGKLVAHCEQPGL
jgi:uncharacterized integral membrane protein